jgi:hypothetical protein
VREPGKRGDAGVGEIAGYDLAPNLERWVWITARQYEGVSRGIPIFVRGKL